jgi:hypothetical protein
MGHNLSRFSFEPSGVFDFPLFVIGNTAKLYLVSPNATNPIDGRGRVFLKSRRICFVSPTVPAVAEVTIAAATVRQRQSEAIFQRHPRTKTR